MDEGTARLRVEYVYSQTGRDLYEAGHVTASREYARGPDPFKWPEEMRNAALHDRACGFDDTAAYARIRAAMVPDGRSVGRRRRPSSSTGRRSSPPMAATCGRMRKRR